MLWGSEALGHSKLGLLRPKSGIPDASEQWSMFLATTTYIHIYMGTDTDTNVFIYIYIYIYKHSDHSPRNHNYLEEAPQVGFARIQLAS